MQVVIQSAKGFKSKTEASWAWEEGTLKTTVQKTCVLSSLLPIGIQIQACNIKLLLHFQLDAL